MLGDALVTKAFGGKIYRDIDIGANLLKTTNLLIKQGHADRIYIRNAANNAYKDLSLRYLRVNAGAIFFDSDDIGIWAPAANDDYGKLMAYDNDTASVEVLRWAGAADPYVRIGRDDTGVALNAITDGLILRMGGGTGNEAQGQGFGIAFNIGNGASQVEKRGSIDCYLETATDGSEDTDLHFWTMAGGALNQAFKVGFNGELYADLDGDSGSYLTNGVNLFDEFDDVEELRKFQLTVPNSGLITEKQRLANRGRMYELGVIDKKTEGKGYHLKIQTLTRLLAGGIYQNRQYLDSLAGKIDKITEKVGV